MTKKLPSLPPAQRARLDRVRRALEVEHHHHGEFGGKRLAQRMVVSIPLGRRWRAIFIKASRGYTFRGCLSHESYNKLHLKLPIHENQTC